MARVLVPAERWLRWHENFDTRHPDTHRWVAEGALHGHAPDGASFVAHLPFGESHHAEASPLSFLEAARPPRRWGVILVRKGGFAVAALAGEAMVESHVGKRHVQGRSKAGGQSQQRFARRRDNQARQAYEAAAHHAARILGGVERVVVGGDRAAVEAVLDDPRLRHLVVCGDWQPVPDPRRAILEGAVRNALAFTVDVHDEAPGIG